MMADIRKPEVELDLAKLAELLSKGTRGPWRIDQGLMADNLQITAHEREPGYGDPDRHDGSICTVYTERHHFKSDKDRLGNYRGESRSWKTPILKARADAELIVAAVNALPELLRRLGYDGAETAWLIEWEADKYGPIRYWAAGEPKPVIDANHATRFARREDANAVMGAFVNEPGKCPSAHEHMWIAPKRDGEAA